jgi:hypothetical protein
MAQTCLSRSGGLEPISLPLFQGMHAEQEDAEVMTSVLVLSINRGRDQNASDMPVCIWCSAGCRGGNRGNSDPGSSPWRDFLVYPPISRKAVVPDERPLFQQRHFPSQADEEHRRPPPLAP